MTPLHGIACFYNVGFGARAVSRKTPIYFILLVYFNDDDNHDHDDDGADNHEDDDDFTC